MFTRINLLKNIGKFEHFEWTTGVPDFGKINLIFGYNGSGKTTISNIFSLFSRQRDDENDLLFKELSNNEDAQIAICIDNQNIEYSSKAIRHNVYVFNSDFISEHVFDGTVSKCKGFSSSVVTTEQLKNRNIEKYEAELKLLHERRDQINDRVSKLEEEFEAIKRELSSELNAAMPGKRTPSFGIPKQKPNRSAQEIRGELDQAYQDYSLSQKQEDLKAYIRDLEDYSFKKIDIKTNELTQALSLSITDEARKALQIRIEALGHPDLKNTTLDEWFENGFSILCSIKGKKPISCPLCTNDLEKTIDNLLADYQAYFGESYNSLLRQLDGLVTEYNANQIAVDKDKENEGKLRNILNAYSSLPIQADQMFLQLSDKMNGALSELLKQLAEKKKQITKVTWNPPDNLERDLGTYNSAIAELEESRSRLLADLKSKSLDPTAITENIKQLIPQFAYAKFDSFEDGDQVVQYKQLQDKIPETDKEINTVEFERNNEIAKLKDESKYVNSFLKKLGVHHFNILIGKASQDNIKISFSGGTSRNKLKHSLSESEKTTLAFAYFLSKFLYEVVENKDGDIDRTIVVIDDPVSSLDENRLYTTACLVNKHFQNAHQLFVLSHNLFFMRFLNNLFYNIKAQDEHKDTGDKRNDYFLSNYNSSLIELPKALRNYTTSYFMKVNDIVKSQNGELEYGVAKNYLPNHIRTVLETFLSFKFCILKQGSSYEKYLSPGLDKLINVLRSKTHLFSSYEKVGNIDHESVIPRLEMIKKVTDPQSHGTPQDIDEITYISEAELRGIVRETIDILSFFDRIHFDETTT